MRWIITGLMAAVIGLAASDLAQACGCGSGCCCAKGGNCPNCPGGEPGSCLNCPQHASAYSPHRYWSANYNCYLYYDQSTQRSYYWSESRRAYYQVGSEPATGSVSSVPAAVSDSTTSITHATRYYSPAP